MFASGECEAHPGLPVGRAGHAARGQAALDQAQRVQLALSDVSDPGPGYAVQVVDIEPLARAACVFRFPAVKATEPDPRRHPVHIHVRDNQATPVVLIAWIRVTNVAESRGFACCDAETPRLQIRSGPIGLLLVVGDPRR